MGVAAALGAAVSWALASTLVASQVSRVDTFSITAMRAVWALLFFIGALFVLGAEDDLARMSVSDFAQLASTGLLSQGGGETFYLIAIAALGMSRAFTMSIGFYALLAYLLSFLFLDETVSWEVGLGSVLIVVGVGMVAMLGRAPPAEREATSAADQQASPAGGPRLPLPLVAGGERGHATAALNYPSVVVGGSPGDSAVVGGGAVGTLAALRRPPIGRLGRTHLGLGLILGTVTGLFWASSAVWLRDAAEGFDAASVGVVRFAAVTTLLLIIASARSGSTLRRRSYSLKTVTALGVAGTLGIGLGSLLFIFALQRIGAGQTSVLWSTSPLFALPLGVLFLGERVTVWLAVGTVIAVGGIVLLS